MEKGKDWEMEIVMRELVQGKQLVKQLKRQIESCVSKENWDFLVEKIISSNERALSLLTATPPTESSSPDSDPLPHNNVFKKRKTTMSRSTKQVRVCPTLTGAEGPLGDEYGWRKYGQKEIMGANYPRAYYRCTHRNSQGCSAIKQVQRSDEDPYIYQITYRGTHTCSQFTSLPPSDQQSPDPIHDDDHLRVLQQQYDGPSLETHLNFVSNLEVKTEDTASNGGGEAFPSFSFTSIPAFEETYFDMWAPNTFSGPTSITSSPLDDNLDFSILDHLVLEFDPNMPFDLEFCS